MDFEEERVGAWQICVHDLQSVAPSLFRDLFGRVYATSAAALQSYRNGSSGLLYLWNHFSYGADTCNFDSSPFSRNS